MPSRRRFDSRDPSTRPARSSGDGLSGRSGPPDLNATLELVAGRIGDRIGERLARAIGRAAGPGADGPAPGSRRSCSRDGCEKPAVAKGLCKSHYNLMAYHRRRGQATRPPSGEDR